MAKKKNPWEGLDDADKPAKDSIKKTGSKQESNPPGKDGKPRKMIRVESDFHAMAKKAAPLLDMTMEDYIGQLIEADFKEQFPELFKRMFPHRAS
jgi:hypothetical protein